MMGFYHFRSGYLARLASDPEVAAISQHIADPAERDLAPTPSHHPISILNVFFALPVFIKLVGLLTC